MNIKKRIRILSLFLITVFAYADDSWKTDFETALINAKEQNKHVLINFTGSDWCGWCIKLENEVFSQDAFKQFAESNLVLVETDFPNSKELPEALRAQNEALLKKYNVSGFPTILILSPDNEIVAKTGYREGGAEEYVKHIQELINK